MLQLKLSNHIVTTLAARAIADIRADAALRRVRAMLKWPSSAIRG